MAATHKKSSIRQLLGLAIQGQSSLLESYQSRINNNPVLNSHCPVCGTCSRTGHKFRAQKHPSIDFIECNTCALIYAEKFPSNQDSMLINNHFFTNSNIGFSHYKRLARHITAIANFTQHKIIRILDIGGGTGNLFHSLVEEVRQIENIEIHYHIVDSVYHTLPASNDKVQVFCYNNLHSVRQQFDLIVASAVLEHIASLRETLQQISTLLATGGECYIRGPWISPLIKLLPFIPIGYPIHLYDFSASFWHRMPSVLALPLEIRHSSPSIIENSFSTSPFLFLLAWILKLPAHLECRYEQKNHEQQHSPRWKWVGGWEVIYRKIPSPPALTLHA